MLEANQENTGQVQEVVSGPQVGTTSLPHWDEDHLARLQRVDATISRLVHYRALGRKPSRRERQGDTRKTMQLLHQWERVVEKHGVRYRRCINNNNTGQDNLQLLLHLPTSLHSEVLKGFHDQCGHQGVDRTELLVRERCRWTGLYQEMGRGMCQNVSAVWLPRGHTCQSGPQ